MDIYEILEKAIDGDASDIFLVAGLPVTFKKGGRQERLSDEVMMPEGIWQLVDEIYTVSKRTRTNLEERVDDDFSFALSRLGRFRVNVFRQRGTVAAVIRVIRFGLPDPASLGIPEGVLSIADNKKGLVLITGSESDWYQVWYQGTTGYMNREYLSVSSAADGNFGSASVKGEDVRIRSGPGTDYSILGTESTGASLAVTGVSGSWVKVSYNGSTGYISANYLSVGSSGSAQSSSSYGDGAVRGSYVRVRSGPGTDYSILGTVSSGTTLPVSGESNGWYKVTYNGAEGYISGTYLSVNGSTADSPSKGDSSVTSASGTGTINATYVRLRSGPGTGYGILEVLNPGASMTITGESGDWYRVSYNGSEGYVYKTYLSTGGSSGSSDSSGVTAMSSTSATVISAVHMRNGPDTSYASQRVLDRGTTVTITGSTEKWYRVTYNGSEGYIFKTYLTTEPLSSSSGGYSASEGERIVAEAKKYLGVGYVYGGSSPSGFDCSGFVYYVFRQCGYSVTRTAVTQNGDGYQVSRSELQPGDIIIFYNSSSSAIGHSGIYIGNGQFIHASSGGGKVMISDLSSSYYNSHYYSARRVVG